MHAPTCVHNTSSYLTNVGTCRAASALVAMGAYSRLHVPIVLLGCMPQPAF